MHRRSPNAARAAASASFRSVKNGPLPLVARQGIRPRRAHLAWRHTTAMRNRSGFAWLELLLGLAAIFLLLQMFPSLFQKLIWAVDLRNWSQLTFFLANIGVVLFLVSVRFGPSLAEDWRKRKERLTKEHAKAEKSQELKKQKEIVERMKAGRRRRIY